MERLLLIQSGFLGDVILSTPLLGNLQTLFVESRLSVLTTPQAAELLRYHPAVAEVIVYDKRQSQAGFSGLKAMAAELRQRSFSRALSLHKSWRTALLLHLAAIPERVGFREAAGAFLYTKTAARRDQPHEVLRNLALLRAYGYEPSELKQDLEVVVPAELQISAAKLLESFC